MSLSIVIPTLNEGLYIEKLLQSLVLQTLKSFDVIVVDGESSDKTIAVVKTFTKKLHIHIIQTSIRNVALQRNLAAKQAKTEWLLFVDADSQLFPWTIAKVIHEMNKGHMHIFSSLFLPDSSRVDEYLLCIVLGLTQGFLWLFHRMVATGAFVGVRASVFRSAGGFNPLLTHSEDEEFVARLRNKGIPLSFSFIPLFRYSFRRYRKKPILVILFYLRQVFRLIFWGKPSYTSFYPMGGQEYENNRRSPTSF